MNDILNQLIIALQEYIKKERGLNAVEHMYAQMPVSTLFDELNSATTETERALGTLLEIVDTAKNGDMLVPLCDVVELIEVVIKGNK
jgi:hypothetical protein